MQSSASSNLQNKTSHQTKPTKTRPSIKNCLGKIANRHGIVVGVAVSRIFFGIVLIISGLTKAVDPWGGLYKIADYLMAWGIIPQHETALTLASILATFEFGLGVVTVLGSYRRAVRWLAPAFMGFMTILSLYIWIANPVEDCGCFGEAFKLSNSETFFKNIVLMVPAIVIAKWNLNCRPFVKPALQWLVLLTSFGYISYIQIVGYHVQPLVDFRPYPVGVDLAKMMSNNDTSGITFIYEKDGQRRKFDAENLPDETWTFVERVDDTANDNSVQLSFVDQYGDDVTSDVIVSDGDEYILVVAEPVRHGISRSEMANRLSEYCDENDAKMIAVVAVSTDSLQTWTELVEARYDVYSADDTDLKMLSRGEAAVVMLHNGVIQWKRNIYSLPPEFPDGEVTPDVIAAEENDGGLLRWTFVWLLILALIVIVPCIFGRFNTQKK